MKKIFTAIVLSAFTALSAAGQNPVTDQQGNNEHNRSTVDTNSTNTSIPAMPIAAPAIQFEGC